MSDKLIYSFQKNSQEEVRVSLSEYKGHNYIDFRIYFKDEDGEFKPTKKGLAIAPNLLPEMEKTIEKLKEAALNN